MEVINKPQSGVNFTTFQQQLLLVNIWFITQSFPVELSSLFGQRHTKRYLGRCHTKRRMGPPFFWYDTDFLELFFLVGKFLDFFFGKNRCHTKRRARAATRAHPSFGMTLTQDIRDPFRMIPPIPVCCRLYFPFMSRLKLKYITSTLHFISTGKSF